jgi:hypothetical protein
VPDATPEEFARELIEVTRSLLNAIAARDWKCLPDAVRPEPERIEPEARG